MAAHDCCHLVPLPDPITGHGSVRGGAVLNVTLIGHRRPRFRAARQNLACTTAAAINTIQQVEVANKIAIPVSPDEKSTPVQQRGSIVPVADLVGYLGG